MASGFPGSIDNFTDPLSNSPLTSPNHATLHADVNDAIKKIETYATRVFTNEAARDAAVTSPFEGQRVFLTAPTVPAATGGTTFVPGGIMTIYNGTSWVCISEVSARTDTGGTVDVNPWVALTGGGTAPTVTLTTGTKALVTVNAIVNCSVASTQFFMMGVVVTGASTIGAGGYWTAGRPSTVAGTDQYLNGTFVLTGLTAGTNTFGLQYGRVNVGGAVTFSYRSITGVGLL